MKGLKAQHLGVVIDDQVIAPPSQFALAYIGTRSKKTLEGILAGVSRDFKEKKLEVEDAPILNYYLDNNSLNIETLAEMSQRVDGSQKIIIKSSVLPVNKKGHLMSISSRLQVSAKIDSRQLREEQKPYEIQIYNPFEILKWGFQGGTRFSETTLERGKHWNEGLSHEQCYLSSLSKTAKEQFEQPCTIIDYPRACALIALNDIINSKHTELIKFKGDVVLGEVELPFDFSVKEGKYDRTKYALEAFLLRYAPRKIIREVIHHETGYLELSEIDVRLLGKKIVSAKIIERLNKGEISKGVVLQRKSFSNYNWAIIQALEEYYFKEGRKFKGYSLEFANLSEYRTTSIVFDMPLGSRREGAEEQKKISSRIIFDEMFGLPYILYKVFVPESYTNKWGILGRRPTEMINLPEDRQKSNWTKKWQEIDWRTNQKALCTLREPKDEILRRASELIAKTNRRQISPYSLRGGYIQAMKNR